MNDTVPTIFEDMFEGIFKEIALNYDGAIDSPLEEIDTNVTALIDIFFSDRDDVDSANASFYFVLIGEAATEAITRRSGESPSNVWLRATELCASKQRAYGPNNIALFGTPGVVLRMSDKNERLKNLINNGGTATADESIDDTYIDLVNYSAIGIATHRGWWTREQCPQLRSAV